MTKRIQKGDKTHIVAFCLLRSMYLQWVMDHTWPIGVHTAPNQRGQRKEWGDTVPTEEAQTLKWMDGPPQNNCVLQRRLELGRDLRQANRLTQTKRQIR
jgi:hypothetical protein